MNIKDITSKCISQFHCKLSLENEKRLAAVAKSLNISKTEVLLIGIAACEQQLININENKPTIESNIKESRTKTLPSLNEKTIPYNLEGLITFFHSIYETNRTDTELMHDFKKFLNLIEFEKDDKDDTDISIIDAIFAMVYTEECNDNMQNIINDWDNIKSKVREYCKCKQNQ